jgi:hypothetical protein
VNTGKERRKERKDKETNGTRKIHEAEEDGRKRRTLQGQKKTARVSDRRGNNKCMQNIYVGTAWNAKVLTAWEGFKINVTWKCPE